MLVQSVWEDCVIVRDWHALADGVCKCIFIVSILLYSFSSMPIIRDKNKILLDLF